MRTFPFYSRFLSGITLIVLLSSILAPLQNITFANDTTHYVDATLGVDGADGLTQGTAWQSINRVNQESLLPGDQVLFKCGESWTGQLNIGESGISGSRILFGSYGSCTPSNKPILYSSGGLSQITSDASYIDIQGLSIKGLSVPDDLIVFSGGTDISISDTILENNNSNMKSCLNMVGSDNYSVTTSSFSGCYFGIRGGSGAGIISDSQFAAIGNYGGGTFPFAIRLDPTALTGNARQILRNTFTSGRRQTIQAENNTYISENSFLPGTCAEFNYIDGMPCFNIMADGAGNNVHDVTITNNLFLSRTATGHSQTFSDIPQEIIHVWINGANHAISSNVFSGGSTPIAYEFTNGTGDTMIANNIFYNSYGESIFTLTRDTENLSDRTLNLSNNTFHGTHPLRPFVHYYTSLYGHTGSRINFSANSYLNLYKTTSSLVEFQVPGNSRTYTKNTITELDLSAQTFTHFANKVYASNGAYSGVNILNNPGFTGSITGWAFDPSFSLGGTLTHDNTGKTMQVSQSNSILTVLSDPIILTTNATYEVSGFIKNLTHTGGDSVRFRMDGLTDEIETLPLMVPTSSGSTFTYLIKALSGGTTRFAIDFYGENTTFQVDNLSIRQKTGVNLNPRTNEVFLFANYTGNSVNYSCPGGGVVCAEYVDFSNASQNWNTTPITVGAYASQLIFWNNSPYVLRPPTCSLVPDRGTVANGQTVTLTWSSTNALSNLLRYVTNTGTFNVPVASSGNMTIEPPGDATSQNFFYATNDVGTKSCQADIIASNTPPFPTAFYGTGTEDDASITGTLQAVDFNSGDTVTFSKLGDPLNGMLIVQTNGDIDYTPNPNFCGVDTFQFIARDNNNNSSDPTDAQITVLCQNDAPVAIDDMYTLSGNTTSIIDPKVNDVDVDMPFTPQTFSLSGLSVPTHGMLSLSGGILRYTPVMGYVGADSFMYTIQDQFGALSNTGTVNIAVMPVVNIPPVGFSGSYTLLEDGSYAGTLSGSDANNDTITFSASMLPIHGTLLLDATGAFLYTPSPDYNGSDSFTFRARDAQSSSAETTIQLSITPISDTPVVQNDTVFVPRNGNATILALQNDTDADNPYQPQILTITGYTVPTNGSLSVVGTGFFYTPTMGFSGTDMFDYSIVDQDNNLSNTGTVNITVSPVNQPPVASMDVFTGAEDTMITATLSGSDPDETPVTYILDTPPSSGTVTLSMTGLMTFTPAPHFYGSVVFLYRVSDGILSSPAVSVVLNVTSVNDLPVANNDTLTGAEDTLLLLNSLLQNDTDVDSGSTLSISGISTLPLRGVAILSGSNLIEYTPTPDFCGTDMFQYIIEDEFSGASLPATVNINVTCVNDAPILTGQTWTTTGNIWTNSGNILMANLVSLDPDMDVMTYSIVSGVSTGSFVLNPTGIFTYAPPLGFSGMIDFTYTASDGVLTGSTVTGSIFVLPNTYNVLPVSYSVSLTGSEDMPLVGSFSGSDIENDPLVYTLVSTGAHGTVIVQSGGTFLYVPNANYFGMDTFTYRVMDPFGSGNTSTILINLASVNDAPVALNDSGTVLEDSINNILLPLGNDLDIDGDILMLTGTVAAIHGSTTIVGSQIQYTPNPNYAGPDTLIYTVTDGIVFTTAQVALIVVNVPDAPVAPFNTFHTNEDAPLLVNIFSGATDSDGDTLSLSGVLSLPAHGTVSISGGLVLYTPVADYNGMDSFTFQITDGTITTAPIVASIVIHPINDTPIGIADTVTSIEDTSLVIPVLANDTDIDGDSLSISSFTQPIHGTVSLSGSGLRYTPSLNYSGADMFTYMLNDGTVSAGPVIITLTVLGVNDTPTVGDRGYTLTGNVVLSPGIVLSGGFLSGYLATQNIFSSGELSISNTDVDGDILTFSFLATPTSGTIALLSGRFFDYTPAPDFVGLVTVPFRATDGSLTSGTGILSLCIFSPNTSIPLPSCAPGYRPPMSNIIQGPGGGGGGGSTSVSSEIFGQVISNGVSSSLASQLFLSTRVLSASGLMVPVTVQSVLTSVPKVPYTALFDTIQESISSTQDVFDLTNLQSSRIRSQAQKYVRSLVTSSTITDDQKIENLDQSIEILESHLEQDMTDRQYGLIQYMIRLFQSKKTYLLPSMEIGKIII